MRKIYVIILLSILADNLNAQFNHLQTQYIFNPFILNPACAGEQGYMSATASYRRQWTGLTGAPETFIFGIDSPIRNRHHNIGMLFIGDKVAVINRNIIRAAYAYRITGRKTYFAAGIAPGVALTSYSWSDVQTNLPDNAFSSTIREMHYEVNFGLYFHSQHFFAGASGQVATRNSKEVLFENQPLHAYSGVRWGNQSGSQYTISFLGRYMPVGFWQLDVNAQVMFRNRIGGGVSYRWKESLAGILQIRINEQFIIGYSYDYATGVLQNYSNGSHELMLRYDFGYTVHAAGPRN